MQNKEHIDQGSLSENPLQKLLASAGTVSYAGFWGRFLACFLDGLLYTVIAVLLGWMLGPIVTPIQTSGSEGYEYDYGYLMAPIGTLYTLACWFASQTTPGKRAIGARIVDARTGGKPTVAQFLLRYVGYLVSALPFGLGYIWAAFDRRKQGWHDKIAGTVVVHARGGR